MMGYILALLCLVLHDCMTEKKWRHARFGNFTKHMVDKACRPKLESALFAVMTFGRFFKI